jgi:hypothetical protein
MQATSTPTLAQPKYGGAAALGAAAILAVGLAAGALIIVRPAAVAPSTDSGSALGVEQGLAAKNAAGAAVALPGSAPTIEDGLAAKNATGASATVIRPEIFTTPTGTTVLRIGGRDPMAHFNSIGLSTGVSDHDLIRGSRGWYAYPPVADDLDRYPAVPWVQAPEADGNTRSVGISHR